MNAHVNRSQTQERLGGVAVEICRDQLSSGPNGFGFSGSRWSILDARRWISFCCKECISLNPLRSGIFEGNLRPGQTSQALC